MLKCFVVSPIGADGSDIRRRADKVLSYIITPIAKECGYEVMRADQSNDSGSITTQMIEALLESDLVIADLTGHNPNVFYEVAARHSTGKSCIQMILEGETIPFDLFDNRTIHIKGFEYEQVTQCQDELRGAILVSQEQEYQETPLSKAVKLRKLKSSDSPVEITVARLSTSVDAIAPEVNSLKDEISVLIKRTETLQKMVSGLPKAITSRVIDQNNSDSFIGDNTREIYEIIRVLRSAANHQVLGISSKAVMTPPIPRFLLLGDGSGFFSHSHVIPQLVGLGDNTIWVFIIVRFSSQLPSIYSQTKNVIDTAVTRSLGLRNIQVEVVIFCLQNIEEQHKNVALGNHVTLLEYNDWTEHIEAEESPL